MPRIGAFEVSVVVRVDDLHSGPTIDPDATGSQSIVFFSKLDCGMWPCHTTITNKIGKLMETLNTSGPGVECDFNSL